MIHPFGLLYSEVTASSLLKVNPDGSVVDQGSTNLGVNKAGMLLHSAIHGARKDARAIIHLHQDAIVAVSLKLQFTGNQFCDLQLSWCLHCFMRVIFRQTSLDYDTSCRYALHICALVNILVRKISVVHFVILLPGLVEISIED